MSLSEIINSPYASRMTLFSFRNNPEIILKHDPAQDGMTKKT
ncbi:MAG: hypothetical protein ACK481_08035 [Candidatus Melainabacteria bacterium]|jgi:hypothetical protein